MVLPHFEVRFGTASCQGVLNNISLAFLNGDKADRGRKVWGCKTKGPFWRLYGES